MSKVYICRDKFKFITKKNKLKINDLSKQVGVTRHTLNNWIKDGTTMDNVMLLAYYLDCSIEELLI